MRATVVREKNQTTIPADVLALAGIRPKDQVDWSFEDGKMVGRKLDPKEEKEVTAKLMKVNGRLIVSGKLGRSEI